MVIVLLLKSLPARTANIGIKKKSIVSIYLTQWGGQKMSVIQYAQVRTSFVPMEKGENKESMTYAFSCGCLTLNIEDELEI